MTTDGQTYLAELSALPPNTFENNFSKTSTILDLGSFLSRTELEQLYECAVLAALCNIAFNGLGGLNKKRLEPVDQRNRVALEGKFLVARDLFFGSSGWQRLPAAQRASIQKAFLRVQVIPRNFAW